MGPLLKIVTLDIGVQDHLLLIAEGNTIILQQDIAVVLETLSSKAEALLVL